MRMSRTVAVHDNRAQTHCSPHDNTHREISLKRLRLLLAALTLGVGAVALLSPRARASTTSASCGPWEICFCRQLGCNYGGQLCAKGAGFTCNQDGITEQ
jgi:hypothetical protein